MNLLILLSSILLAQEPPTYINSMEGQRDISGIIQNDRALSDEILERAKLDEANEFSEAQTFSSGIVFGDGTEQTTAATSSVYSATNTYIGVTNGTNDRTGTLSMYAKSVDGVAQSSGCLVILKTDSQGADGIAIFTSTTTSGAVGFQTVLLDACDPGSFCRVAIAGLVRVLSNATTTVGGPLAASTTRCQAQNGTGGQGTGSSGRFIMTGDGAYSWAVVTPG